MFAKQELHVIILFTVYFSKLREDAELKRAEKNKKSITEIISAAIRLYSKYASTDISVNELCRENNISKGKFYHYFSSKEDLLMVAASYVIDDICADIEDFDVSPEKPLEDNLKKLLCRKDQILDRAYRLFYDYLSASFKPRL